MNWYTTPNSVGWLELGAIGGQYRPLSGGSNDLPSTNRFIGPNQAMNRLWAHYRIYAAKSTSKRRMPAILSTDSNNLRLYAILWSHPPENMVQN